MRRALLLVVIALGLGAALFQLLASRQGFVLVSTGNLVIEMSLWTALLLVVVAALLVWLLFWLWRALTSPGRWLVRRGQRRRDRMRNRSLQGFVDYLEGNWPAAVKNLRQSAPQSDMPAANYLGAAAASFQLGDRQGAGRYLDEAEAAGAADGFATGLLRIRLALLDKDHAGALALAQPLHRRDPSHPTVLRLLATAREGLGDWVGLERMLRDLHKHRALSTAELKELEVEVHSHLLADYVTRQPDTMAASELRAGLDRRWHDLPRHLQKHPRLVAEFVRQLLRLGEVKKAESRLARYLGRQWQPRLVELYGDLAGDTDRQLAKAESWLREHPDDATLLRALGKLCARAELWGKARGYLEKSLAVEPDAATYGELGDLLARLGDAEGSLRCYRQGLALRGKS